MNSKGSKNRLSKSSRQRSIKSPPKAGSIETREVERAVREVARHRNSAIRAVKPRSAQLAHVAERIGSSQAEVEELLKELASIAALEVRARGEFVIPGFGKLVRSERKPSKARNPITGEAIKIPRRTTLKFRPGKLMKESLLAKK